MTIATTTLHTTATEVQMSREHYENTVLRPAIDRLSETLIKPVVVAVHRMIRQAEYREIIGPLRTNNPVAEHLVRRFGTGANRSALKVRTYVRTYEPTREPI